MKNKKSIIWVVLVLVLVVGAFILIGKFIGPSKVKLETGWQLIQINGIVPKGTVLIVSTESNTVLPTDGYSKRKNAYISQGRVNFYKSIWVMTKTKVWAYYPDNDYEFIIKKNDFIKTCQEKLSLLTDGKEILLDEYDVGHN